MFGDIVGGILGYVGAREANATNIKNQDAANNTNIVEAQKNRDWQEKQSNTEVQRRMADLKSAGVNPLLAGKDAASSGSGGAATAAATHVENELAGAASTARDAFNNAQERKRLTLELGLGEEQKKLLKEQQFKTRQEAKALGLEAAKGDMATSLYEKFKNMFNSSAKGIKDNKTYRENLKNKKKFEKEKEKSPVPFFKPEPNLPLGDY